MVEDDTHVRILEPTEDMPFKTIDISPKFSERMAKQWKNRIIVRILGHPWYYHSLQTKLDIMWRLNNEFEIMDLGYNCYCIKGLTKEKRGMILTEGSWQLAGSFLSIGKWTPYFRSDTDKIESTITWARILNLPIEYFKKLIMTKIVESLGDPIKVDGNTYIVVRGRYIRVCVQVCTDEPLELGLRLKGKVYQVVYENLTSVCYACERVEHGAETYDLNNKYLLTEPNIEQPNAGNGKAKGNDRKWLAGGKG